MPNIHGLMQNHTRMGLSVSELFFCLSRETQGHKLFYMRQALALLPSPGEVNSSTGLYSSACPSCLLKDCLALAMNEVTPPLHVGRTVLLTRGFYQPTGVHGFSLSRGDPSSWAVWWPGCVTLLSVVRLELMSVTQLTWPRQCASRSLERHLSGGRKECTSPAYFHLGPHYNKTRIASWTRVEPSWDLCFSGSRSKTTNRCVCRAFYHHNIGTS